MFTSLSPEVMMAVSLGLVLGLIVLLVLQVLTSMRVQRLTYPIYEYAQAKAQADVQIVMTNAHEASRKMLADAEAAATALIHSRKSDIESRTATYIATLEKLSTDAERAIREGVEKVRSTQTEMIGALSSGLGEQGNSVKEGLAQVQKMVDGFIKDVQTQTHEWQGTFVDAGKGAIDTFGRTFEGISGDLKKQAEERTQSLLKELEKDIEAYRENRKKLVDEHMADLIVETSKVVLRKALTAEDHTELVENALKEAHSAGVL